MKPLVRPSLQEKLSIAERNASAHVEEWPARSRAETEAGPTYSVLAQVLANLGNVLRTRRRHGSVVDDLGLGDYDHPSRVHTSVDFLGRQIQEVTARYEPRLEYPQVKPVTRNASRQICYRLTGSIDGAPVKIDVLFDTAHHAVVSVTEAKTKAEA